MLIKHDMNFTALNKTRKLHIYLPDNYYESEERYPVMYFFDGHNLFFDQDATYGKSWGLYDFMQSWSKQMIIVGLECGHEGNERLSEYSPYDINSDFFGGFVEGRGQETMDWIVNEVKPYIDKTYRTYPFRQATGIAGSSMGGLMSIYAAGLYNHIFSKVACLSSAILNELDGDLTTAPIDSDTRIYFSWRTEEGGGWDGPVAKANLRIASYFENSGSAIHVYCQEGGQHREADWEKRVPLFMDFLWMQ